MEDTKNGFDREYSAPVLTVSTSFAEEGFAASPDCGIDDLNGARGVLSMSINRET